MQSDLAADPSGHDVIEPASSRLRSGRRAGEATLVRTTSAPCRTRRAGISETLQRLTVRSSYGRIESAEQCSHVIAAMLRAVGRPQSWASALRITPTMPHMCRSRLRRVGGCRVRPERNSKASQSGDASPLNSQSTDRPVKSLNGGSGLCHRGARSVVLLGARSAPEGTLRIAATSSVHPRTRAAEASDSASTMIRSKGSVPLGRTRMRPSVEPRSALRLEPPVRLNRPRRAVPRDHLPERSPTGPGGTTPHQGIAWQDPPKLRPDRRHDVEHAGPR